MLDKNYYKDYCKKFNKVYDWLCSNSHPSDVVASEICNLRGYDYDRMSSILIKSGFIKLKEGVNCNALLHKSFDDLGICKNFKFLLEERYIFPVKDMLGNVVALIGWYPDSKRYITTPSALFSKSGMFYGMEQLSETGIGKTYFLTEGIFDSLSLRSLGYNAVAQMGINSSKEKKILYGLFNRLVATPDTDKMGTNVTNLDKWDLPKSSSYMTWVGGSLKDMKDIDDFCKKYDEVSLKALLDDVLLDKSRVITFKV